MLDNFLGRLVHEHRTPFRIDQHYPDRQLVKGMLGGTALESDLRVTFLYPQSALQVGNKERKQAELVPINIMSEALMEERENDGFVVAGLEHANRYAQRDPLRTKDPDIGLSPNVFGIAHQLPARDRRSDRQA